MTKYIPKLETAFEILTSSSNYSYENGFNKFENEKQNLFTETLYRLLVGDLPTSLFSSENLKFSDICHSIVNIFYEFNYQYCQDPHYHFHKLKEIDEFLFLSNPRSVSKFGIHHHSLLKLNRKFSKTKRDLILHKIELLRKSKLPSISHDSKYDFLYSDNDLGTLLWQCLLDQYLAYYDRNIKEFFIGGFAQKYSKYIDKEVKEYLKEFY
jgi:hypothetical protein